VARKKALKAPSKKQNELQRKGTQRLMELKEQRKAEALRLMAELGTQRKVCQALGIDRWTLTSWKREDPDFAEAIEEARREYGEMLVDEAHRRAKEGSDVLLMFSIKGILPEYREKSDSTQVGIVFNVNPDIMGEADRNAPIFVGQRSIRDRS